MTQHMIIATLVNYHDTIGFLMVLLAMCFGGLLVCVWHEYRPLAYRVWLEVLYVYAWLVTPVPTSIDDILRSGV